MMHAFPSSRQRQKFPSKHNARTHRAVRGPGGCAAHGDARVRSVRSVRRSLCAKAAAAAQRWPAGVRGGLGMWWSTFFFE
eukprot:gene11369-biopygen10905